MGHESVQKNESQYGYATGRIRALELQLLDTGRYSRLYDARTPDDVIRVLAESGYPQTGDLESSLEQERIAVYQLVRDLMPDTAHMDALLLFHDYHNIKVVLKQLSPGWTQPDEEQAAFSVNDLPEPDQSLTIRRSEGYAAVRSLFLQPSLVEPDQLYQSLAERQPDLIPAWAYLAAVGAVRAYLQTYDVGDIDAVLDQAGYAQVLHQVSQLGDPFLMRYIQQRVDLVNIGLLLRMRLLHSGVERLQAALIPGGQLEHTALKALYSEEPPAISDYLSRHGFDPIARLAETYGQRGSAAQFGLAADNMQIRMIRAARWSLSGPEVPLAYLFARENEIKNIRIVVACLQNGISMNQARDLARDRYLDWR